MEYSLKNALIKCTILFLSLSLMMGCSNTSPQNNNKNNDNKNTIDNNGSNASHVLEDSQKSILSNILELAKEGKIVNCEFPVNTTVTEDVEKKWGKPDKTEWVAAAKGTYATYSKKNVVFGFNKGMQIFEVRLMGKTLGEISLSSIKDYLGTPPYDVKVNGEEIIGYLAGEDYKLLFVFPEAVASSDNQYMDHYSVLYPKGTVNMMADDPGREW
ncbi:MAG TPA: YjgB family protein [Clostridiaceae bacterium]